MSAHDDAITYQYPHAMLQLQPYPHGILQSHSNAGTRDCNHTFMSVQYVSTTSISAFDVAITHPYPHTVLKSSPCQYIMLQTQPGRCGIAKLVLLIIVKSSKSLSVAFLQLKLDLDAGNGNGKWGRMGGLANALSQHCYICSTLC